MKEQLHPQKYDLTTKDILKDSEESLVKFITGKDGKFVRYLDVEFQRIEAQRADIIFESAMENQNIIFHVEMQSDNDPAMLYRMLNYLAETHKEYNNPVYQVVIYIGKDKLKMQNSLYFKLDGTIGIDYKYKIIDFTEISKEVILNLDKVDFLPMLVLTKVEGEPEEHLKSTVNIIMEKSQNLDINTKRNLLLKTEILSGIKFSKELIERIFMEVEKMLVLEKSEGYKRIVEKGIEKGKKVEKLEIAKKLLKKGLDIELIIDSTGLSKKEIENLKRRMI